MYHQRESGILFFLSFILPVDICYGILNMMKTAELEDSRQEYIKYMDNKTITDTDDTSSNDSIETTMWRILLNIRNQERIPIYRNINSTEQTRTNISKIKRLSKGTSGIFSVMGYSVTDEANSELAEKTVSQIMLDRAITDKFRKNYFNNIYNNLNYIKNETYNDIIVNNIN